MTLAHFYGKGLPGYEGVMLPGKLLVLEGPDGVGRSTQIALLREWLEAKGFAVSYSGLKRSELASKGIASAKQGHTLDERTMNLFYVADLADRLEREIIPALKAGFVVVTDRYMYSLIARSVVRGVNAEYIRAVLGFCLIPDAVFYLKTNLDHLIPRVLRKGGFDYWEAGVDFQHKSDYYDCYCQYQSQMLAEFDRLGKEYAFRNIDATRSIDAVFTELKDEIGQIVLELKPSNSI
ncbi:hypothetical protein [uncultured Draconibacterium sp.]|uniref:dTMP kinase n=1 Tax=uncultured Draconibacterium sp. TaxID=1573823 RepID=UPI003217C41E